MRIAVRGWGRDQGEKEIMNSALAEAETETFDRYTRGKTYLAVQYPKSRRSTVRISTSTELRLGGRYLMHVELNRDEIAQLFFETHGGDIVRMFRTFMADEERQRGARQLEWSAQYDERRRQREKATEATRNDQNT